MSNCSITRNSAGEITKVLNKEGVESQLYKNIAKHPLITNTEQALEVYKNAYSEDFADLDENAINFTHEVDGKTYSSFKDALTSAQENQTVKIGFETGGK